MYDLKNDDIIYFDRFTWTVNNQELNCSCLIGPLILKSTVTLKDRTIDYRQNINVNSSSKFWIKWQYDSILRLINFQIYWIICVKSGTMINNDVHINIQWFNNGFILISRKMKYVQYDLNIINQSSGSNTY